MSIQPGWYADPSDSEIERQWDGSQWTPATRPKSRFAAAPPGQLGTRTTKSTVLSWGLLVGGVLVGVGTLLPWLSATTGLFSVSRNAFQLGANDSFSVDGILVLGLGVIIAAAGVARTTGSEMTRTIKYLPPLVALATCVVLIGEFVSVNKEVTNLSSSTVLATVGAGFWMCLVGGALALIAALGLLDAERR